MFDRLLKQAAIGDRESIIKLCLKLADRAVFIPVEKATRGSGEEKLRIRLIVGNDASYLPVFSSKKRCDEWITAQPGKLKVESLFGADVCLSSLHQNPSQKIMLDPGHPLQLVLGVEHIKLVAGISEPSEPRLRDKPRVKHVDLPDAPNHEAPRTRTGTEAAVTASKAHLINYKDK